MPHTLFLDDKRHELVLAALRHYATSEHAAFKRKAAATLLADLTGNDADANITALPEPPSAAAMVLYLTWSAEWMGCLSKAMLGYVGEADEFVTRLILSETVAGAMEKFCRERSIPLPALTFGPHVHPSYVFGFEPADWLQRAAIERTTDPTENLAVPN